MYVSINKLVGMHTTGSDKYIYINIARISKINTGWKLFKFPNKMQSIFISFLKVGTSLTKCPKFTLYGHITCTMVVRTNKIGNMDIDIHVQCMTNKHMVNSS